MKRCTAVLLLAVSASPVGAVPRRVDEASAGQASEANRPTAGPSDEGTVAWQFALARSLSAEGDTEAANEAWREVVELAPEEPYVRLEYARFLARAGRPEEARQQVGKARRLAPDNRDVLRAFADLHLALSRSDPTALSEAQDALETMAAGRPHDVETLFDLGRVLYEQGRWREAVTWLERAAAEQPGNRAVQSYRVSALLEAKQDEVAISVLENVLQHDPTFLTGRLQLATLLSDQGEHRRAVEVLAAAPPDQRRDHELLWQLAGQQYRVGAIEAALGSLDSLLAGDPGGVRERILKALVLAAAGRDEEAIDLYGALIAERPRNLHLVHELVQLYERNDRPAEAEAVIDTAEARLEDSGEEDLLASLRLELLEHLWRTEAWSELLSAATPMVEDAESPLHVEAVFLSVEALHRSGRADRALELLSEAAAVPRLRRLSKQAEILYDEGRREAADAVLDALAAEADPQSLLTVGRVLDQEERYAEAVPVLERALELEPDSIEVLYWLGASHERQGDREEAGHLFGRLLELEPEHAPTLNYLGYMWAEQGERLTEALDLVRRAVAQEPDNGAYVDSLGWAQFKLGNYAEARDLLERAARLVPHDAVIAEHLGDVYWRLGESDLARVSYRRALELGGENREQVRQKLDRLRESL